MLTIGLLLGNIVLLSGLAVVGWRNRSEPGAAIFALLEGVSAVWAGLAVAGLRLPPGEAAIRIWGAATGLSLVVVVLWMAFILRYTGRDRWLHRDRLGVASVPLLGGSLLYAFVPSWTPFVGQIEQSSIASGTAVYSSIGPVGALLGVYIYLFFMVGLVLVLKSIVETNTLYIGQALAFLLGSLVTVIASAGEIVGFPVGGYPLTEVALGPQAILWGYAVFGHQFLTVVPAVARIGERAVFEEIEDGILVVDDAGTVARANPQARSYLGTDPVGESVDVVLDRMDSTSLGDLPTRFQQGGRNYQVNASDVRTWRGEPIGHALVIRDVTRLSRRQQRLEVLNRIMRHNLRNDMNVVRGCANQIHGTVNGEVAEMSSTIVRKADGLLTISEKAVEINRMLEHEVDPETIDLERFLGRRIEPTANRNPDATVEMSVDPVELRTVSRLLSLVVEEVVENALAHAGETPLVRVEASATDDGARIEITDDGDGIPELEVAAVTSGRETNLEHATSLGLWLIHWGTQALGGEAEFDTSDDGTTVTLRVPHLELDEDGTATALVGEGPAGRAFDTARSTDG